MSAAPQTRQSSGRIILIIAALAIVAGLLILGLQGHSLRWGLPAKVLPAALISAGLFAALIRRAVMLNILLLVYAVSFCAYLAEGAAEFLEWNSIRVQTAARRQYAAANGFHYDPRTQSQVTLALMSQGSPAYPVVGPDELMVRQSRSSSASVLTGQDGQPLVPLGGVSNSRTVYGNETGEYLVYRSDERGFNNPSGLWTCDRCDVALIGDSIAQGCCVPPESNSAAVIRRRFPATLNLGRSGNGPLSELATIREYLPARRPRLVLWLYSDATDLSDLEVERTLPQFIGYLGKNPHLQSLESRQGEIDRISGEYMNRRVKEAAATASRFTLGQFLSLTYLRDLSHVVKPAKPDYDLFERILETARDDVGAWQGRLVFVYLPIDRREPAMVKAGKEYAGHRVEALKIVHRAGIPSDRRHFPVSPWKPTASRPFTTLTCRRILLPPVIPTSAKSFLTNSKNWG